MKILKGYVKNCGQPKGCIVERYIVEEVVDFCIKYLGNVDSIGLPRFCHTGRTTGKWIRREELLTKLRKE